MLELGKNPDIKKIVEQKSEVSDYREIMLLDDVFINKRKAFFEQLFGTEILENDSKEPEKKGGSYGEIFKGGEGDMYEVHHMPADSVSNLERNDGPAIKMEKVDHKQTASCGMSREAREYRNKQKELLDQGKFREALQMDMDDIHEKFGDKYNDAIAEMLAYVDKIELEGKING